MGPLSKILCLGLLFILQIGEAQEGGCVDPAISFGSKCRTLLAQLKYPADGLDSVAANDPIDDLATHELWLHILLQLDRPYEDRLTTHRGDKNYVYYLDNEIIDPTEHDTPIIIPTIDAFTTGNGRFKKLLNYSKGRDVLPSMFEPDVKEAVHELYEVYKDNPGAKGILMVAVNGKDYVNEYLHMFTLMHAIVYDKELYGFGLPAFYDVIPELFTTATGCNSPSPNCCQVEEYPPNLTKDEWKLSYWREDAGFNNFHGSWHFYNNHSHPSGPVLKLNHGELFYYFHNQLVARYDMERLSNGLEPVTPLNNWTASYIIPQNYFPPVLTNSFHSLKRCDNISAETLEKLVPYRTNLLEDISNKHLMHSNGSYVDIDNDEGIKYVGCAIEQANCGNLSTSRYGGPPPYTWGIHNDGHAIISSMGCTEPPKPKPHSGVMGSKWTAVRDPLFFRWHKFNDHVFQLQKKLLPEYKISTLALDHVAVSSIGVQSVKGGRQLGTFNSKLKMIMWFNGKTSTCIYQPTGNHHPFTYTINVNNNAKDIDVNVRIYMAPKLDPAPKTDHESSYEKLRTQWALMDRFKHTLTPGKNIIIRDSCNSSITVPRPKSLPDLIDIYSKWDEDSFNDFRYTFDGPFNNTWGYKQCNQTWDYGPQTLDQCKSRCLKKTNFSCTAINYNPVNTRCILLNCSVPVPTPEEYSPPYQGYARITKPTKCQCGLPEHLLIPRGTPEGMLYQLFVYITPRNKRQSQSSHCPNQECSDLCSRDYTGCDHSDGEAMGFPFDRPLKTLGGDSIKTIEDLTNKLPNAMLHDIMIVYDKDAGV